MEMKVLVKGAGDLATGVALVLKRAGFEVVMTEIEKPTVIRRTVSFADCMYKDEAQLEGVNAKQANRDNYRMVLAEGKIPVLADPEAKIIEDFQPRVVVDAILAKKNLGTHMDDAELVIGLGPGFSAGKDVHVVIETMRGHDLGRIIHEGEALPNTNTPGIIGGRSEDRVLRAPGDGLFKEIVQIGDYVKEHELVAEVDGKEIKAPFDGVVRGLLKTGLAVFPGMKVGDVDPRPVQKNCFSVSDKARALGGATLLAIMEQLGGIEGLSGQ